MNTEIKLALLLGRSMAALAAMVGYYEELDRLAGGSRGKSEEARATLNWSHQIIEEYTRMLSQIDPDRVQALVNKRMSTQ